MSRDLLSSTTTTSAMAVFFACRPPPAHCARAVVCTQRDPSALRDFPRSAIAPLVPFRAPQYWSSGAQLQAYGLELQALVAHIVSQRADKGGFRLSTATSWSTRCANNIDLFSRRYSSRHMLFIASHRRVSTDYRTHAMAVITMNTRKLPSPIRLPTTIPSDSTNGWLISARAPYYPQAFATSQSAKTSSSSSTKLAPACDA